MMYDWREIFIFFLVWILKNEQHEPDKKKVSKRATTTRSTPWEQTFFLNWSAPDPIVYRCISISPVKIKVDQIRRANTDEFQREG